VIPVEIIGFLHRSGPLPHLGLRSCNINNILDNASMSWYFFLKKKNKWSREGQTFCEEGAESGGSLKKKMAELPKEDFGRLGFFY